MKHGFIQRQQPGLPAYQDARIVDQNIQSVVFIPNEFYGGRQAGQVGYIRSNRLDMKSLRRQFRFCAMTGLDASGTHEYRYALSGELATYFQSGSPVSAGNKGDFLLQRVHEDIHNHPTMFLKKTSWGDEMSVSISDSGFGEQGNIRWF